MTHIPRHVMSPTTPHQVRTLDVRVERLDDGKMRVSTPSARGWAAVANNHAQLADCVRQAFTEAQIAAYARWRGERTELDALTDPVRGDALAPPRARVRRARNPSPIGWGRNQQRPDLADPGEWKKMPDGRWESPGGKLYRPETLMVRRVLERRRVAGLST